MEEFKDPYYIFFLHVNKFTQKILMKKKINLETCSMGEWKEKTMK